MMNTIEERYIRRSGPVNQAFGLTYASFLVVPRTLLMDMPVEWQSRFVELMDEYNKAVVDVAPESAYDISVTFKQDGKFCKVPEVYTDYKHAKHKDIMGSEV